MVSRERLLCLGATLAGYATTRRVRVLAQLLLVVAIAFVVLRVRSLWHGGHIQFANVDWGALAGSCALAAAGTAASGLIWVVILDGLGVRAELRWAGLFFKAQLGKYIPGSVWQYAGRAAGARAYGIPVRPVAVSLPIEFVASAIAAGSTAGLLLGWWGGLILAAVVIALIPALGVARQRLATSAAIRATLLYVPVWLLLGASFWLCARGLVAVPARDLAFYIAAFAVAWLAGLVALYAPGGLGVREAVLVALLSSRIGAADALVVAAASRLMLIFADVVLAGVAAAAMRRDRRPLDVADPA